MTTIAADFRALVMVSDSRCTAGEQWFPMTKVHKIGAELIGLAGSVKEGQAWLKWYSGGKRGTKPKGESYVALILRKDGLYEVTADGLEMLIERGFHACGSGGPIAVALMIAGHSAQESVEIACQVDTGSGGEIKTYSLGQ